MLPVFSLSILPAVFLKPGNCGDSYAQYLEVQHTRSELALTRSVLVRLSWAAGKKRRPTVVAKVGRESAPHKTLVALTGSLITAVVLTPAGSSYLSTTGVQCQVFPINKGKLKDEDRNSLEICA